MKMLKKFMAVALAAVLALSVFTACDALDKNTGAEDAGLFAAWYNNNGKGSVKINLTGDNFSNFKTTEIGSDGTNVYMITSDIKVRATVTASGKKNYISYQSSSGASSSDKGTGFIVYVENVLPLTADKIAKASNPEAGVYWIDGVKYTFDGTDPKNPQLTSIVLPVDKGTVTLTVSSTSAFSGPIKYDSEKSVLTIGTTEYSNK